VVIAEMKAQAFAERSRELGYSAQVFKIGRRTQACGYWTLSDQIADLADTIESRPGPLGLLATDTEHGWRAFNACLLRRIAMPDKVALVCAGEDAKLFDHVRPSITSIAQDTYRQGWVAAELLHRQMQGETDLPPLTLIPPIGVIERTSTDIFAYDDREVVAALRYIWDHVADQVSIDDVLEQVLVSASTLARKFRNTLGRTPGEEIMRSRVDTAKRLLTMTDLPLMRVALDSGFGHQSQLSRYIKQATGLTPLQLRGRESKGY
jgi:LacI family transcriptional regulator